METLAASSVKAEVKPPVRKRLPLGLLPLFIYLAAITIIGKGPAYLGIPPVFWGEIVLAWTVLWALFRYGVYNFFWSAPKALALCIVIFFLLGAAITIPGYLKYGIPAIRDAAIWYYAALFFVGAAIARDSNTADAFWLKIRWFWPLVVVWFFIAYVLAGGPKNIIPIVVESRGVPLFGSSGSELVMHCGLCTILLCLILSPPVFRTRLLAVLIAFAGIMLVAMSRGRGAKLSVFTAFLCVSIVIFLHSGRFISRITFAGMLLLFFAGLFVAVVMLEEPLTKVTYVERFSPEELSRSTGAWRTTWWEALYNRVNRESPFFGLGFGQSLSIYSPYLKGTEKSAWPVRSPHNVNMTVFARMGYIGAFIWLLIIALGIGGLWYRLLRSGAWVIPEHQFAEIVFWGSLLTAVWVNSSFGVLMEGPVLGFWFWFAMGFGHSRLSAFVRARSILYSTKDESSKYSQ